MSHDAELVAKVAEAIWTTSRRDEGTISATGANIVARAVLDALDLPGRERRAKAEALTQAARDIDLDLGVGYTMPDDAAATREAEAWLLARAAEIDPEEGDHE